MSATCPTEVPARRRRDAHDEAPEDAVRPAAGLVGCGVVAWRVADARRDRAGAPTTARQRAADRRSRCDELLGLVLSALPLLVRLPAPGCSSSPSSPSARPSCTTPTTTRSRRRRWLNRLLVVHVRRPRRVAPGCGGSNTTRCTTATRTSSGSTPTSPWHPSPGSPRHSLGIAGTAPSTSTSGRSTGSSPSRTCSSATSLALISGRLDQQPIRHRRTTQRRRADPRRQARPPRMGAGRSRCCSTRGGPCSPSTWPAPGSSGSCSPSRSNWRTASTSPPCTTRTRLAEATTSSPTNLPPPPTSPPRSRSSGPSSGGWSAASITRSSTTSHPGRHHLSAPRRAIPPGVSRQRHHLPPPPRHVGGPPLAHPMATSHEHQLHPACRPERVVWVSRPSQLCSTRRSRPKGAGPPRDRPGQ